INAPNNSYNSTGQHDIPEWVYDIFRRYGFGCGADYSGSMQDWMHVEFMGTPGDAAIMTAQAVSEFLAGNTPGTPGGGSGGSVRPVTHYGVKSGDTLSGIASKFKVTVQNLIDWNNLKSTNI